jgi:hypothetical protein
LVVVEDIYFLDLVFLNDEIVVVNQRMDFLVIDEKLKMRELIIEEEAEVEKQAMIENEMDAEIDGD